MKTTLLLGCLLLSFAFIAPAALANDGFYEGAGTTLIPVHNDKLRVVSEKLDITPLGPAQCFGLLYAGKPVATLKQAPDDAQGTIGPETPCPADPLRGGVFQAKFHAKAIYHVKALDDADSVQMGFPIPKWTYEFEGEDELLGLSVPGVTHFKTSINGSEVTSVETKSVEAPIELMGASKDKAAAVPAMVWRASFKKGVEYELTTEYDFGYDISNGFYPPNVPKDRPLWWDTRTVPEGFRDLGGAGAAETAIYYLHPIKLWASPAPDEISVRFEAPKDVPVTYLVTGTQGLDCIDTDALYFNWKQSYPTGDLTVSYPSRGPNPQPKKYESIRTPAQFETWIRLLGENNARHKPGDFFGDLKITCALADQIKKTSDKYSLIVAWTGNGVLRCVQKCR